MKPTRTAGLMTTGTTEQISQRELGRRLGVTDKAIRKGIKAGRLEGLVGHDDRGQPVIRDAAAAVLAWTSTSRRGGADPVRGPSPQQGDAPAPPVPSAPSVGVIEPMPPGPDAPSSGATVISATTLVEAQRLATVERARKLALENDITEGKLVSVQGASKESFDGARTIREAILNIPARIAGELAAEADPVRVHIMLEAALRQALNATADELLATVG